MMRTRRWRRERAAAGLVGPQAVVLEHLEAALLLHPVMLSLRPPADHRLLVAPDRKRQQAAFLALAGEALILDEPVDRLELRLQLAGEREILVPPLLLRADLEDDGKHPRSPPSFGRCRLGLRREIVA